MRPREEVGRVVVVVVVVVVVAVMMVVAEEETVGAEAEAVQRQKKGQV